MEENILITGGAGFIGSHLADALINQDSHIYVFDNLSSGTLKNVKQHLHKANFTFIKGDLLNLTDIKKLKCDHFELIFHLAANSEVRIGSTDPTIHFRQNIIATYNLLEQIRKRQSRPKIIFTSTSTVYGDASKIPTPEKYAPLKPISTYGASKLACEALISAYAYTYDFNAVILRLANIVGPRSTHGVIYDFIQKLKNDPTELEILGDGTQTKSYLYIDDCIKAILYATEKSESQVEIYNISSEDQIDVKTIAQIVIEEMHLKNVKLRFTGGINDGRGWRGDIKNMQLDISKLKTLGWKPTHNSKEAIRKAVKQVINQFERYKLLERQSTRS